MYKISIFTFIFLFINIGFTIAQVATLTNVQNIVESQSFSNPTEQIITEHLQWRNIGPSVMSGRVVDLAVNPQNPLEFFVAYATGGVWYTKNNGQSFKPIFEQPTTCIGAIAVNWPQKQIWVGTGEVNSSRSSYAGQGVFKGNWDSTFNFNYVGLSESHHIGKILLHPTNSNIAYIAVLGHLYTPNKERGLYKTINGGQTFEKVLYIDDNTGVVDIDINPNNPKELIAAAWYKTRSPWNFVESGNTSGIYKSVDEGNTWQRVNFSNSGFPNGEGVGRIGIAYAAKDNIVYAVLDNNFKKDIVDTSKKQGLQLLQLKDISKENFLKLDNNLLDTFLKKNSLLKTYNAASLKIKVSNNLLAPTALFEYLYDANTALFEKPIFGAEVYKSTNGGLSWKKVNTKPLKLYNTYGYYFGKIFVSPTNSNKVIITGYDIELSTDGGATFKVIDKPNVHPDHHSCWINPNNDNHLIIGNDGGVNITYDNGDAWFKANTPAVGQFYAIQVDNANPYNVYGGLQDNGTWFASSTTQEDSEWYGSGENPFKGLSGGDGMQVMVDNRNINTVYSGFQFGNYYRIDKTNWFQPKFKYITPQHTLGQSPYRFNWQSPILLSPHHQDIFYLGSNKLHKSFNRGDSLPAISEDLTNGKKDGDIPFATITTISESVLRPGMIVVGTDDGNIQLAADGGYTFTKINNGLPTNLWISRVIASQYNVNRIYATLNGYRNDDFRSYVYVSNNKGQSWQPIFTNLKMLSVNVIKEDPLMDSVLYVGSDNGVYMSTNFGKTAFSLSKELPKVPVHDLVIHPQAKELIIGTHGRSIFILKLNNIYDFLNGEIPPVKPRENSKKPVRKRQ
jgi:hypothetical protein